MQLTWGGKEKWWMGGGGGERAPHFGNIFSLYIKCSLDLVITTYRQWRVFALTVWTRSGAAPWKERVQSSASSRVSTVQGDSGSSDTLAFFLCFLLRDNGYTYPDHRGTDSYWAVRWSWFARVNSLCNLSRKKSREVAASLPGRFLSRRCFTLCITMEVEPRIAKQYKCHHRCNCKNYRGKGMEGGKGVFASFYGLPEDREFMWKNKNKSWGASYSTSNLLLVARHILTTGLHKCL